MQALKSVLTWLRGFVLVNGSSPDLFKDLTATVYLMAQNRLKTLHEPLYSDPDQCLEVKEEESTRGSQIKSDDPHKQMSGLPPSGDQMGQG